MTQINSLISILLKLDTWKGKLLDDICNFQTGILLILAVTGMISLRDFKAVFNVCYTLQYTMFEYKLLL